MAQSYCVGIDLGTTFASVAVVQKINVEVIANSMGTRLTPSCVAFTETERLVGNAADNHAHIDPRNTIYNVKRIIGRQYDDVTVQQDIKTWPFTVTQLGGKIKVKAKYKGKEQLFSPEEICAMILTHMKETAEAFLNQDIRDVVITVPAHFNDFQRRATKDAGTIAGLNILRIINEPTAVALAYGYQKIIQGEKIVLVFDFGGGTLDVSIVKIRNDSEFEVKASAGNTHLGGSDLNERMKKYFLEDLNTKFKCDLSGNPLFVKRLLLACELAKIFLSKSNIATVNLESVSAGMNYSAKITKSKFEALCDDLFRSILEPVQKALEIAKLGKDEIDDVILAGGSSRIPKVQQFLSEFFDGKKLNKTVNPDEAIAYGAAVQASMLGSNGDSINDLLLVDVTSLSLGIDEIGGIMSTIIKRGTPIPVKHTITYTTTRDNQTAVRVGVFEGECALIKDNTFLGEISLTGITPAPSGMERVDITFSIDADSILNVVIQDQKTGNTSDLLIHNNYGRLSKDELQRMIEVARKFHEEDERMKEKEKVRNHLETYAFKLKQDVLAPGTNLSLLDKHFVTETCEGVENWLLSNDQAELEEISQKLEDLLLLGSIIEIK